MADLSKIRPGAEVIGADGVHIGMVDYVDGDRLKLTKSDSVNGRHHYIDGGLIADIENGRVRLSAIGAVAVTFEEQDPDTTVQSDGERLEEGLEETFPASDPVSASHIS